MWYIRKFQLCKSSPQLFLLSGYVPSLVIELLLLSKNHYCKRMSHLNPHKSQNLN